MKTPDDGRGPPEPLADSTTTGPWAPARAWWMALLATMAMAGCAHAERPERQVYIVSEDAAGVGTAPGSGGAGGHDCQQEHEECMELCWNKRYPWPHSPQQSGWYYKRCTTDCARQYNECMDEQEEAARARAKKLEFSRMDRALEWLRAHKAEVALGTIVIVGGVAFILATGGSGAWVLVPLAL